MGRTRAKHIEHNNTDAFQLTRPVWGEPVNYPVVINSHRISTHSPRVGRTESSVKITREEANFNSLAPCGANQYSASLTANTVQISTHSPRVGRTGTSEDTNFDVIEFQLTRPVWGEPSAPARCFLSCPFQLTRPVWGEPVYGQLLLLDLMISTHSPRVGRTDHCQDLRDTQKYFNSLAPCGANLAAAAIGVVLYSFQLTRPVWGEPLSAIAVCPSCPISTHSPRVGRTCPRQ